MIGTTLNKMINDLSKQMSTLLHDLDGIDMEEVKIILKCIDELDLYEKIYYMSRTVSTPCVDELMDIKLTNAHGKKFRAWKINNIYKGYKHILEVRTGLILIRNKRATSIHKRKDLLDRVGSIV